MAEHYYSQTLTIAKLKGLATEIIDGYYPELESMRIGEDIPLAPTKFLISFLWHKENVTLPFRIEVDYVTEPQFVILPGQKTKQKKSANDYNRTQVRRRVELLRHQFLTYFDDRKQILSPKMLEEFLPHLAIGENNTTLKDYMSGVVKQALETGYSVKNISLPALMSGN